MNVVLVLLIGLVVVAVVFWKLLAWWIVLWIVVPAAIIFVVVVWLARVVDDLPRALVAKVRGAWQTGLSALRAVPHRVKNYWIALPTVTKLAVAGVTGTAVVGGTAIATGSTGLYHRAVLAVAPALIAWTGSEPAYNALLWPQFEGRATDGSRAIVVRAGTPTRLSFGISPQWMANSIVKANPNPKITQREEDIPLKVTVTCDFCAAYDAVIEPLVYRPSERSSNFVRFDFVPLARADAGSSLAEGRLVVSVVHTPTAQEYDRLPITVLIDPATVASKETDARVPLNANIKRSLAADNEQIADVQLFLFEHQDRRIRVEVQPVRDDLKRALAPYVFDGAGKPRSFITSVFGQSEMHAITTAGYTRLSELSLQGPFASRLAGVTISKNSRSTSRLESNEARDVRAAIALTGATLYRKLFVDSIDPALSEAIELLESYEETHPGSPPLRLLIQTDLQLPWQYLHPIDGAVEGKKFWGMRFNLAVERTRFEVPGAPDASGVEPPPKVVFARYALQSDDSTKLADEQIRLLQGFSKVEVVDSKNKLFAILNAQRRSIAAIVTFLHASSTKVLPTARANMPLAPRLYFAPGDFVAVDELENLMNVLGRRERQAEPRYLRGGPLVILNACETGPSTIALSHLTLENMMFKLGAQGVIATEVPVWIPLANEIGQRLITRLSKGEPASGALTAIRRELNDKFNNPLGLLYAYYGSPPVGLRP